ncbi:MAG: MFS transporter [Melioribacteraceae bacterium]|nr:MFS transporter [Melioribacteraceae bacterium]
MNKSTIIEKIQKTSSFSNTAKDERIDNGITNEAYNYYSINFFLIIISNTLTKLADTLSNPKTVLAWLMSYVNAPLYLIGFLVPIRESGSMLPQIIIASYVRKMSIRKWIWVFGSLLQFISMASIGIVAISFEGELAGWLIILLLIVFSISRALSSVSSKDVLGKTIPKKRRGRLNGYSTSISGILSLFAGLFIIYKSEEGLGIEFYGYLIFFASSLWLLGAIVYSFINEFPGETSIGKNAVKEAFKRLILIKEDKPFRDFVIARSLLLCSALTAPFYVVLSQTYLGKDFYILGLFILANGIASSISAPFWGKMADKSSKNVMVKAALITSILGILMFFIVIYFQFLRESLWLYPAAFFILGIAHSGVRLGRKTYIVDMAKGNKRTDYVSVSNTIIGLVLLITGGVSALASVISAEGVLLVLSLFGLAGAFTSHKLPNVE